MTTATELKSPAERVRDSEARKVEAGGRRLPGGVLSPDAAKALDSLQRKSGASATACIARALIEAAAAAKGKRRI